MTTAITMVVLSAIGGAITGLTVKRKPRGCYCCGCDR